MVFPLPNLLGLHLGAHFCGYRRNAFAKECVAFAGASVRQGMVQASPGDGLSRADLHACDLRHGILGLGTSGHLRPTSARAAAITMTGQALALSFGIARLVLQQANVVRLDPLTVAKANSTPPRCRAAPKRKPPTHSLDGGPPESA